MVGEVRHFVSGEEFVHIDLRHVFGVEVAAEFAEGEVADGEDCEDGDAAAQVGGLREVCWDLLEDVQVAHPLLE